MSAASPNAKRGKKLLTWVIVIGTGAIVAFVALMVMILSSPRVQKFLTLASESQRIVKQGQDAPGAKEVRAAGGCQVATVDDMGELAALGQQAIDGGTVRDATLKGKVVVCIMPALRDTPECDALANAYVDAAHPTEPFYVTVRRLGASDSTCTQGYEASGARIPPTKKK